MSAAGSRRIGRSALVRLSGEIVAKATSLVFFVTMAPELGRSGFGTFVFALGLAGALVICAGFGTDDLTARRDDVRLSLAVLPARVRERLAR